MRSRNTTNGWLLCFETGDELIEALRQFATTHNISCGTFTAIGAASEVELGFYDLPNKTYYWKTFSGMFELTSGIGNISKHVSAPLDDKTVIHMHGTFADADYRVFGGHVRKLVVGATVELVLCVSSEPLLREYDEKTGLNLWKL